MLGSRAMLGFLHGGASHVETFEQLVQAAQPSILTQHVVREDLLASAVTAGRVTVSIATAVQADVRIRRPNPTPKPTFTTSPPDLGTVMTRCAGMRRSGW